MTLPFHVVAIIGFSPIERAGLELLLRDHLEAIAFEAPEDVVAAAPSVGAAVIDLTPYDLTTEAGQRSLSDAVSTLQANGALRLVGVSGRAELDVRLAPAHGVDAVVDRDCRPDALVGAVVDPAPQRRPWVTPAIAALPLSARERDVLERIAGGCTSKMIAASLGISSHTVESHKQRLFRRLGVQNQAQAVAAAVRLGLLEPGAARSAAS